MNPMYLGQHPCLGLENIRIEGNKGVNLTFEVIFPKVQLCYVVAGLARYPALLQRWMRICPVFVCTPGIMSNENFGDSEPFPEVTENELSLNRGRFNWIFGKREKYEIEYSGMFTEEKKRNKFKFRLIHDATA